MALLGPVERLYAPRTGASAPQVKTISSDPAEVGRHLAELASGRARVE
jgi:hypothetical protein